MFADALCSSPAHEKQLVSSLYKKRTEKKLWRGHWNFIPGG
jgi:hypothetical protein